MIYIYLFISHIFLPRSLLVATKQRLHDLYHAHITILFKGHKPEVQRPMRDAALHTSPLASSCQSAQEDPTAESSAHQQRILRQNYPSTSDTHKQLSKGRDQPGLKEKCLSSDTREAISLVVIGPDWPTGCCLGNILTAIIHRWRGVLPHIVRTTHHPQQIGHCPGACLRNPVRRNSE